MEKAPENLTKDEFLVLLQKEAKRRAKAEKTASIKDQKIFDLEFQLAQ